MGFTDSKMEIKRNLHIQKKHLNNINRTNNNSRSIKLVYNSEMRYITGFEYRRPVKLKKALYDVISQKELKEGIVGEKVTIQRFLKDLQEKQVQKILERKVVSLRGYGSSAVAFETADGKIIKLTDGNHFPLNRPHAIFDVPVFKRGNSGSTYFYIEEKLYQHNMPLYWVETVKDMIKSDGYRAVDIYDCDTHQIGISQNGRVYLVDPECARYKTPVHAIVDKAQRALKKYFSSNVSRKKSVTETLTKFLRTILKK